MRELRWLLLVFALCLPIVLLVAGVFDSWGGRPTAEPLGVPAGDQEVAWIHTTTAGATWERFVTGVVRAKQDVPGLEVDDSRAFLESTTEVPEVVLSRTGHAGHIRLRWYKLQSGVNTADWVRALAARNQAPLAVIGGGSTDRAIQLAEAMNAQETWHGDRPPLLITTATADFTDGNDAGRGKRLADVYDDRTFRFCFSNQQMAEAVIDFVFSRPDLSPRPHAGGRNRVLTVEWEDDKYSLDLREQFQRAVADRCRPAGGVAFEPWTIPLSVGGFVSPNVYETQTAASVSAYLRTTPDERVLLVMPSATQPARRFLQAVVDADPQAAAKLVVVTGDSIPLNAVLRDGEFAWPVSALPVPLVFFTHANPVAWDESGAKVLPDGYRFDPPNGTEEAMHFRKLAAVLAEACYPVGRPTVAGGQELIDRLKEQTGFFDDNGERKKQNGEHVVVVTPGRPATLTVWQPGAGKPVRGTPLELPYVPAREAQP